MQRTPLLVSMALMLATAPAPAQDAQPARGSGSVTWYLVHYVRFKPGMESEARRIIYDHFWPVDREIGREAIPFDYSTGEWDHVVHFPLPGGPGDLAVQETPIIKRWNEVFARREGGKDKADALYKRYSDMVLLEKIEVASRRSP